MRPRWQKVLSDFFENKARSILIIASILVGVFAVGVVGVGYYQIPASMVNSYLSTNPANIVIKTNLFDDDFVETIKNTPGAADVEGRNFFTARAQDPQTGEWLSLSINAVEDINNQNIKQLYYVGQTTITQEREILLVEDALDTLHVSPGETLAVELTDGTRRELKVSGIVRDYSSDMAINFDERTGYIGIETLEYMHEPRLYDTLIITVTGNQNDIEHIQTVAKAITEQVENSGRSIISKDLNRSTDQPYANYSDAIATIIGFLGVFIVILSSALIINTMNALMSQHVHQIGIIKLVGGSRQQITGMYLTLVFAFSLIALLIAIPASAFVGRLMCENILPILNSRLNTNTNFIFLPQVILIQSIVALIIPLGAALYPIVRGANVPIQKALSAKMIKSEEKKDFLDRWLTSIRAKDGIITLGIRNTFRQKARLMLTIFTLALGCAIFISVFNVELVLNKQIDRVLQYNQADIYLDMDQSYPINEINAQLSKIPGVTYSEAWLTTTVQMKTDDTTVIVYMIAPPDDSPLVKKSVDEGQWVNPNDYHTIAVNDAFWNTYPDLKAGDQILLNLDGKEELWTVSGLFHYTGLDQKIAYTPYNTLAFDLNSKSHSATYRIVTSANTLKEEMAMAQKIDDSLTAAGYNVLKTTTQDEIIKQGLEKMNVVVYVLLFLAVLTGIVGGIGLSGTLSLNVLERTAEIGILRAVGAYDTIIIRLVTFESLFIGLTSYLLGVVLSFPISYALTNMVNLALFGSVAEFAITTKGFIFWFFILLALSLIASYFPARNAARLTIREVLAYE